MIRKSKIIFKDQRGWMVDPFEIPLPKNTHVINLLPNIVRGNHYHLKKTEYICILNGKLKIALLDLKTNKKTSKTVTVKEPLLLTIPPQTVHALKNIGKKEAFLICYATETFDEKNPGLIRQEILK